MEATPTRRIEDRPIMATHEIQRADVDAALAQI